MKQIIYRLFFIVCILCIFPLSRVLAVGEFQADYDVEYAISPAGVTIVTQNVTLTNKQSNLYPQKYSILIDSQKIKNVIAFDNGGLVQTQIDQSDGKTQITLPFNDHIVGLGKQLHFSLRYEDAEITQKNGDIWEVNIPGVANDPDLASYTVTLNVPPTFGPNAYMTPMPAAADRWTKDQMITGGISAAYGNMQAFDLNLSYHLENDSVAPRTSEISLPPDTAFQKVIIRSITPKPKTVLTDADGNWLAQYDLLPAERLDVQAQITVAIQLRQFDGVSEEITDPSVYTKPLKYWESQSPQIQALAQTYKTPRDIYNYVVRTLSYDYTRVSQSPVRKGALEALATPKNSICMEYTDLFVAIARAAGIPAREVVGFAYTTNSKLRPLSLVSDVLHSWPEYYDSVKKVWIQIDPTWASTTGGVNYFDKLDFNHIAFSIHGIASDYPYPAGFYKRPGTNSKDVLVAFSQSKPSFAQSKLITSYVFPKVATSGIPAAGTVTIENPNGTAVQSVVVTVQSTPFDVAISKTFTNVAPYAKLSIPVSIPLPGYFMQGTGSLTATVNDQASQYNFQIRPLVYSFIIPLACIALFFILLALLSIPHSSLWKHRRK